MKCFNQQVTVCVASYIEKRTDGYRIAQKFDGGNFDKFDKRPAIRQSFPFQPFPC